MDLTPGTKAVGIEEEKETSGMMDIGKHMAADGDGIKVTGKPN
jgi:hypothetical protein